MLRETSKRSSAKFASHLISQQLPEVASHPLEEQQDIEYIDNEVIEDEQDFR